MTKIASLLTLLPLVQGVRVKRQGMTVAGIPMQNYRAGAEDFVITFNKDVGDAELKDVCKGRCKLVGSPDKGGVPFAAVHGWKEMEQVVRERPQIVDMLQPDQKDYAIPEMEVQELGDISARTNLWGLERIGAQARATAGRGVHIFVQDTGVRASHNDFGGRVVPTLDLTAGPLKECNGDTSCAADRMGHGSHCAGSAAGATFGVAPQATIRAVKTLDDAGAGDRSWQLAAIDWVTASGIRPAVISMSLGGIGVDPQYTRVIGAATAAGVTVVVAAGNLATDACQIAPAFEEKAITVGSTNIDNARSYFSNYGRCTNIWAPGSAIISASHTSDSGATEMSGTSMACPHVAGAAALVLERNPSMNYAKVLAKLHADAGTGFISDLKTGDTNKLTYVGFDAPPDPPALVCADYCSYFCSGSQCPTGCC